METRRRICCLAIVLSAFFLPAGRAEAAALVRSAGETPSFVNGLTGSGAEAAVLVRSAEETPSFVNGLAGSGAEAAALVRSAGETPSFVNGLAGSGAEAAALVRSAEETPSFVNGLTGSGAEAAALVRSVGEDISFPGAAGFFRAKDVESAIASSSKKIPVPEISVDGEEEKEKLREAVRALDSKGLSPKKLAERLWNFLTGNRDLIEEAGNRIGEAANEVREKAGKELDKAAETAREKAGKELDKAAESVTDKAKEKISEEIGSAFGLGSGEQGGKDGDFSQ